MFFALGSLVAGLIALLIIPAVNARAERLARRRLEALFPLSISELTAEKDHLRAEFAVMQRRLERKAEEALANKHQEMEELGRRAVRIETLQGELAGRDHRIGELEADLERTRAQLAATEGDLLATRQALAASQETQAALETAHRRILDEFGTTRGALESTTAVLAETRTALAATEERLARRESEFTDIDARHTATLSELGQHRSELADEHKRVADLAQRLAAEQARATALEERVRGLEAEHASHAAQEAQGAAATTDMRSERNALLIQADERRTAFDLAAAKLAEAERRIAELQANPRGGPDGTGDQGRADTAELRQRIEAVAEDIMRVSEAASAGKPERSRSAG